MTRAFTAFNHPLRRIPHSPCVAAGSHARPGTANAMRFMKGGARSPASTPTIALPTPRMTTPPTSRTVPFTRCCICSARKDWKKPLKATPIPKGYRTGMWHSQGRRAWHICKGSGIPACKRQGSRSLFVTLFFSSCRDMQLTSAICGTRRQQYGNPSVDRDCTVTVIHIGLRECVQGYQQRECDHYLFHLVFFFRAGK